MEPAGQDGQPTNVLFESLRKENLQIFGVLLLGLVGLSAATEGVRVAWRMIKQRDKAKWKTEEDEGGGAQDRCSVEEQERLDGEGAQHELLRHTRQSSGWSSGWSSDAGSSMDGGSFGKTSSARRRRKAERVSGSPAKEGRVRGLSMGGDGDDDEFDADMSLDGLDEMGLSMRLTNRSLRVQQEGHEGGDDEMQFDRSVGRWRGNESALLDFEDPGASPMRHKPAARREVGFEDTALNGAFGIPSEEIASLRREAKRSAEELGVWFREGMSPFTHRRGQPMPCG